ncbi:MAG TPA: MlaD family protein [Candidatus Acidoferrales bacterium]|jgi:phospholipid/cholesterol/gamma-HCH transport system substrate-binding protein|nr:MlaD family protein [Candidatus Acidoferrales bacterium]
MNSKRESALVGLFVLVAAGLLIVTVFLLSGSLGRGDVPYRTYFKNAGGLAPGSEVRYAGGPPIGRVQKVTSDPQDPTRMEVDFSVNPDVPVKTNSTASITSTSPLADNFLGIVPGTAAAPRASPGATLKSTEYISFADIAAIISGLGPNANDLIANLDARAVALQDTLNRVNDVLSDRNRANISASLGSLHGMLDEDRPAIHSAIDNLNDATAKVKPLLDDFRKTSAQATDTLAHLDATISEDRPDLRAALASMKQTLASANVLADQLNQTLNTNAENLDEILDNLRHVSANLNAFTETIKTRPYTLIRASGIKPHKPGEPPPR